jgi:hypothetical protein
MRSPDGSFRTAPSPARWGNAIRLFPGVSEARNMPANSTLSNYWDYADPIAESAASGAGVQAQVGIMRRSA